MDREVMTKKLAELVKQHGFDSFFIVMAERDNVQMIGAPTDKPGPAHAKVDQARNLVLAFFGNPEKVMELNKDFSIKK